MLSPSSSASKPLQERTEHATSLLFVEISLSTCRSSLCLGGCETHKEARGLFMKQRKALEIPVPSPTLEQDIQNK